MLKARDELPGLVNSDCVCCKQCGQCILHAIQGVMCGHASGEYISPWDCLRLILLQFCCIFPVAMLSRGMKPRTTAMEPPTTHGATHYCHGATHYSWSHTLLPWSHPLLMEPHTTAMEPHTTHGATHYCHGATHYCHGATHYCHGATHYCHGATHYCHGATHYSWSQLYQLHIHAIVESMPGASLTPLSQVEIAHTRSQVTESLFSRLRPQWQTQSSALTLSLVSAACILKLTQQVIWPLVVLYMYSWGTGPGTTAYMYSWGTGPGTTAYMYTAYLQCCLTESSKRRHNALICGVQLL